MPSNSCPDFLLWRTVTWKGESNKPILPFHCFLIWVFYRSNRGKPGHRANIPVGMSGRAFPGGLTEHGGHTLNVGDTILWIGNLGQSEKEKESCTSAFIRLHFQLQKQCKQCLVSLPPCHSHHDGLILPTRCEQN